MHPWRPWILLAALVTFVGHAAVVYKWTDDKGVVHYSDQSVPGAEKIFTATSSNSGLGTGGRSNQGLNPPAPKKQQGGSLNLTTFALTSPMPDQTYFGDEVIPVHVALDPALAPGQTLTWHLNGKQLDDQGTSTIQFALQSLDRGTYVIAATLTDPATGDSQTTPPVNFFVRQPSELSPQHKKL